MKEVTVRSLGGELWAELNHAILANKIVVTASTLQSIVDLSMSVIARHCGTVIENDEDFPVAPLPRDGVPSDRHS
jgi:hypothetical protein